MEEQYSRGMIDGRATFLLSYSERYVDRVARPVANALEARGIRAIMVGEEPLPSDATSAPSDKVEWFFRHADMVVYLATPDDRLQSGGVQTRQNIIDEHRLGQQMPHLRNRLLVFKAAEVILPSNLNPVYEQLPEDDPDWIVQQIMRQAVEWRVIGSDPVATTRDAAHGDASNTLDRSADKSDSGATKQVDTALRNILELRAEGHAETDLEGLVRSELAIAGHLNAAGSEDVMSAHAANRIFRYRHSFRLSDDERRLLLRTYLQRRREENTPGIYWIAKMSKSELTTLLTDLAINDPVDEIRSQSLSILAGMGQPRSDDDALAFLEKVLARSGSAVRSAAFEFIASRPGRKLRPLIAKYEVDADLSFAAIRSKALIDLRSNPTKVFRLVRGEIALRNSEEIVDSLVEASNRISEDEVRASLGQGVKDAQLIAIRVASRKGILDERIVSGLYKSKSNPQVVAASLKSLLEARLPLSSDLFRSILDAKTDDNGSYFRYDNENEMLRRFWESQPNEKLVDSIEWTDIEAPIRYEVFGRRHRSWAKRFARKDLQTDFERVRKASRDAVIASSTKAVAEKLGRAPSRAELAEAHSGAFERLGVFFEGGRIDAFMLSLFQSAALKVLVENPRREDVKLARRFANSDDIDVRKAALDLFEKVATTHDASTLKSLSETFYTAEDELRAAKLAYSVTFKKNRLQTLLSFSEKSACQAWAISELASVSGGLEELWKMLRSDTAEKRDDAVAALWDGIADGKQDDVLNMYMEGHHYYNVVREFDKRINAPRWLSEALDA